jgi:predicted DNA binding protein
MTDRNRRPFTVYEPVVELEFQVSDEHCFLIGISGERDCDLVVDDTIQQTNGITIQFVSVYDGAATGVVAETTAWAAVVDARIIGYADDASLVELVVDGPSLERALTESRAIPRHISASRGKGRVVAEVPPSTDPQQVIDGFLDHYPDSKLRRRSEYDTVTPFSESLLRERILGQLTERQRMAVVTGYEHGYFATPRETTSAECAERLGISQSTFSQHLNVALDKILDALLYPDPDRQW